MTPATNQSAQHPPRRTVRWLSAALIGTALGCGEAAPVLDAPEDFNVLVIVIDTFGVEHAGSFMNPDLHHTPNMDRLAARGVVFNNAYATSPWTQPSVASLFTGAMPARHGLRAVTDVMRPEVETLAEALAARGFATRGVISNYLLRPQFSFARGFESYDASAELGHKGITSQRVTNRAIAWLEKNSGSRFFLFAHYFDPHYTYHHHEQFDQTSDYHGPLNPSLGIWQLRNRRPTLTPADLDYLIGLHREEIAFTDAHIGRLLDYLKEAGVDEKTLVVLTSDHGEEFMRHGWIGHTRTLYEELLHIPMIVALPGVIRPAVVDQPVSLNDVMPTVLALDGDTVPRPDWDGISLVDALAGAGALDPERKIIGEVSFVPTRKEERAREKIAFKTSLMWARQKVIHDLPTGAWELYDLEADPEELHNLIGTNHPAESQLVAELEAWEAARGPEGGESAEGGAVLDAEAIEKLRSLGYIK